MENEEEQEYLSELYALPAYRTSHIGMEQLRSNEELALDVERMWFIQKELKPRLDIIINQLKSGIACLKQTPHSKKSTLLRAHAHKEQHKSYLFILFISYIFSL